MDPDSVSFFGSLLFAWLQGDDRDLIAGANQRLG
jgi:hypothetical protein